MDISAIMPQVEGEHEITLLFNVNLAREIGINKSHCEEGMSLLEVIEDKSYIISRAHCSSFIRQEQQLVFGGERADG